MATSKAKSLCFFSSCNRMFEAPWIIAFPRKYSKQLGNSRTSFSTEVGRDDLSSAKKTLRTSLYDLHVAQGGRMVEFAGYFLPVQYGNVGISASHLHTRNSCSIFDVSHMLQTEIKGPHSFELLESICVADIQGLPVHKSSLSVFTNENGGILDDFVVTKSSENSLYIVSNAACKKVISNLLVKTVDKFRSDGKNVELQFLEPDVKALLAVQGPKTAEILQPLVDLDLKNFYFMSSAVTAVGGVPDCRVTRCGYTGEDGVEISIDAGRASSLVQTILENQPELVKLAGLGARDSLRYYYRLQKNRPTSLRKKVGMEAGLCLYGNDIDEKITPVEAGLTWTIGKRRRKGGDFPGATAVLKQIKDGVTKQRVGLIQQTQGLCPRSGHEILSVENEAVGRVTSGCPSPSLKANIAMGYVSKPFAKAGTELQVKIKDKLTKMTVAKMPFVPSKYYVKPKG